MKLSWNMMDLAVKRLNVSALSDWKILFTNLELWMQAVLVGTLVLLVGVSAISCWFGLKMNRYARFAAGAAGVFHIALVVLFEELDQDVTVIFIWAVVAGVAGGFLYAFVERAFQFVAGFVFGTVLSSWVFPDYLHLKTNAGKGRIWALLIAIGAGILFALLAKKLRIVLTALEGGAVLGILCDSFLPVDQIPWVKDKLMMDQIVVLIPIVFILSGVLVQLIQYLRIRAEKKSLQIPTGEERDMMEGDEEPAPEEEASPAGSDPEKEEAISMAKAEEALVETAKELASAARSSAQQARQRERYEDVSEGLYSAQVAASRLGMSEEAFLQGMKDAGFTVPGEENPDAEHPDAENPTESDSAPQENSGSDEPAPQENGEGEEPAPQENSGSEEPARQENRVS